MPSLATRVSWLCALILLHGGCGGAGPETAPAAPQGLRVTGLLGPEGDVTGFAEAKAPRQFQFPADHGPHPAFRNEWWYLTCALNTAEGREFGVQFTVFRHALHRTTRPADPWRNGQAWLAHFAVTDVAAREHRHAERLARGHPALAGASADSTGARVWLEDWRLDLLEGNWRLGAAESGFAADLRLRPDKGMILQGNAGLSAKGPEQASYYYSAPRLRVTGQLSLDGERHAVTGLGWLDREWSTSALSAGQAGWDWFALMFDSGEDLMAFQLRRSDGLRDRHDHGAWIDTNGAKRTLTRNDFRLQPLAWWRDEQGTDWPVRWALQMGDRRWRLLAAVEDQRMDTLVRYWEGLIRVLDESGQDVGRGYMELTGYSGAAAS